MDFQQDFLSPRFAGKRFEDHAIPLELLEDFTAFEELLVEVAKWIYYKDNPARQRVPRGFTDDISLKLISIGEGSAIPKIILAAATIGLFPKENYSYFERAKESILLTIDAAENNKKITDHLPENLLVYFNKIGKRLRDDESIDFSPNSDLKAILNKSTRKKIVLASNMLEVTNETSVRATIPEVDKVKQTFTILLNSGQRITAKLDYQYFKEILGAFNDFELNSRVLISGIGRFDKSDKLESFETIEHISILDKLDVASRLEEISFLEDGWLNGEGIAPKKSQLEWFSDTFENYYDTTLTLPYLYPTVEGGIQAEWDINNHDITLKVDLNLKNAFYHRLNNNDDSVIEFEYNLTTESDWQDLNNTLLKISKNS